MTDLASLLAVRLEGLRRNPDNSYQARCPVCALNGGGDKARQHLRVWASGSFHCVVGSNSDNGEHNKGIRAHLYANADADTIAALANVEYIDPEPRLDVETVYSEALLNKLLPDYRYWNGRNISDAVLRRLQGGLAPVDEQSKLSGRYCFPVRNTRGQIVGWTGRLVSEASFGPKWKHLCKSSRAIYPCHTALDTIRQTRRVVLVESIGDLATLMTHGINNVLVLLGLNLNSPTIGLLLSVNIQRVIISTNNDELGKPESKKAGNEAAEKIRKKLVTFLGEDKIIIRLPQTAKDWNAAQPSEIEEMRKELEL